MIFFRSRIAPAGREIFSSGWRRAFRCVLGGVWLAAVLGDVVRPVGAADAPSEDQVKAAFLLNFPKYIEWPDDAFADAGSPIVLTVIADKGVERELRRMSAGKLFSGRPLVVRTAAPSDEVSSDCHILFIGFAEEKRAAQIISGLGARQMLTVGECDDFFEDGGVIKLTRRDRKIRLEINLAPASAAGLRISSKLLSVAEVVKRKDG